MEYNDDFLLANINGRDSLVPVMQDGAPIFTEIAASGIIPQSLGSDMEAYSPLGDNCDTVGTRISDVFDAMEARRAIAGHASKIKAEITAAEGGTNG